MRNTLTWLLRPARSSTYPATTGKRLTIIPLRSKEIARVATEEMLPTVKLNSGLPDESAKTRSKIMSRFRAVVVGRIAFKLCLAIFLPTPVSAEIVTNNGGFDNLESLVSYYGSVDCSSSYNDAGGCGDQVGSCSCCSDKKLLGFIAPTAPCFGNFISPMTNPFMFEDPRTLSELRFVFIHHDVPSGVLAGGDVQAFAVQARAAITERLSIIATKDGFLFAQPDVHADGWVDVAAGLKYVLLSNPCTQSILSAGFTYEMPVGSTRALQGNGDGDFLFFASGGKQIGSHMHWLGTTGARVAVDQATGSDLIYLSNHLDYQMTNSLYPFLELNWFHWTRSGSGGVAGLEGNDLYNLGSTGVKGNDIVTMGAGMKHKPFENVELGCVYEFPLTQRKDLLQSRLTIDCIIRY